MVEGALDQSPSAIAHISGMLVGIAIGILFQREQILTTRRRLVTVTAFAVILFAVASPSLRKHRDLGLKYAAAKHYDQGNYRKALEDIDCYLALEPASRDSNLISANIHFRMHDYPDAGKSVQAAIAKDPQDTYSLYFMGVLQVGDNRCDEATSTAQSLFRYYSQYASSLYKARCPDEASQLSANLVTPSMANDPIIWLPK